MAADGLSRMDPSELAKYLAVIRDSGLAEVEADLVGIGTIKARCAGHAATTGESSQSPLTPDEDLPELAFDPIARRRAAKAQT